MKTGQKQETPPVALAGFQETFAVTSCKVDGSGKTSAECKRNLLDHPDVAQR